MCFLYGNSPQTPLFAPLLTHLLDSSHTSLIAYFWEFLQAPTAAHCSSQILSRGYPHEASRRRRRRRRRAGKCVGSWREDTCGRLFRHAQTSYSVITWWSVIVMLWLQAMPPALLILQQIQWYYLICCKISNAGDVAPSVLWSRAGVLRIKPINNKYLAIARCERRDQGWQKRTAYARGWVVEVEEDKTS